MTDPQLPQMETALDARAMAGVLERECLQPAGEFELRDCAIHYVRYKPGRNCVICYDLAIHDRERRQTFRHILCGSIYESETRISAKRWRKAAKQPLVPVRIGAALTHITGLHMVVWAFPNDRRMTGLEALSDPERLRAELLPGLLGEPVVHAEPELVRYVPENRCTVRVAVQTADRRITVYAKAYGEDQGERIHERLLALWNNPAPGLVVPRPLGYRARTLWVEEVPGETMESRFEPAAARAVAALHQRELAGLSLRDRSGLLRQLAEVWNDARATGLASERLARVCQELERRLDELEPLPVVTLHGDLTPRNLLASGGAAGLIDLDDLRRGNPLEDLGSFNAVVYHSAVVHQTSMDEAGQKAEAFVRSYAAAVPWRIPKRDLGWYTAHALVAERIGGSIKRRKEEMLDGLLAAAERMLN